MVRSDSERAPVLSAMLPSVSAWRSTAAACRSNVADLTSPRAYAVTPGPDGTWPLDGLGPAERGLSRGWDPQNVASRRVGSGGGGRPGAGDLGLVGGPLPLELAEPVAEELEEGHRELQAPTGLGVEATDGGHPRTQARLDLGQHPVAREHRAVPGVGLHDVDVAARPA